MKRVFPFLFLFTFMLICGCSANDIEVDALKADIGALQNDVSLLIQQNQELTESLEAMRQEFEVYNDLVLDSFSQKVSEQTEADQAQPDSAPTLPIDMLEASPSPSPPPGAVPDAEPTDTPISAEALPSPTPSYEPQPTPSQTYEQIYQPTGAPTTATEPDGHSVYITATGAKYHYDPNCNSGTYYESTLEEALALGLTPCKRCAGG